MIILVFLFLSLAVTIFIYLSGRRISKALKPVTVILSILLFSLYLFVQNFELSSTPVLTRTINKTNTKSEVYFISFYHGLSPIVSSVTNIGPNCVSEATFEIEGVKELWMVALDESDQVSYIKKTKNPWTSYLLKFQIENGNKSDEADDKNKALNMIKEFKLMQCFKYSLLAGSIILLAILLIKRRKTVQQ